MPRFYFHICEGGSRMMDDEGIDLPDAAAAHQAALSGARSIMCETLMNGRLSLDDAIEVMDEAGAAILKLTFRDAVKLTA